ncbi:methyltransferase [Virgisporangium aliadipatigenens]|uniref:Methyltransferase n=1 Tax=Virgisporangium aliadipatigenens TaxID=741659 RepID=A0A8J3YF79_9ACTN|nr:class I SAM-dependent methyltransferase [Virgisporangium aliadipatigenens]GIJ43322.1 methyltransferase [Virgisporangium aliadipatigenens]
MSDNIFAHPRLAAVYDTFDGGREDLDAYLRLADELNAHHVLDIGCGTGCFALLLAATGRRVTGVDPAAASLEVARAKPGAEAVRWLHGDATTLPDDLSVDLATMTGNVAQVFLSDDDWHATLRGARAALRDGGHLVFETRRPERRAWAEWGGIDVRDGVTQHLQVTDVSLPYVSFRYTYTFAADGSTLTSDSTLRFRSRAEVAESLRDNGFTVVDVRDAPDRPGLEHVFVAHRE